jgi:hypothetical protein
MTTQNVILFWQLVPPTLVGGLVAATIGALVAIAVSRRHYRCQYHLKQIDAVIAICKEVEEVKRLLFVPKAEYTTGTYTETDEHVLFVSYKGNEQAKQLAAALVPLRLRHDTYLGLLVVEDFYSCCKEFIESAAIVELAFRNNWTVDSKQDQLPKLIEEASDWHAELVNATVKVLRPIRFRTKRIEYLTGYARTFWAKIRSHLGKVNWKCSLPVFFRRR